MPQTHPAALDDDSLLKLCLRSTTRRQGPGGQHRNKTESAVVLAYKPTGMICEANEKRSQADNQRVAIFRMRLALAVTIRTQPGSETASLHWQSRVKGGRLAISDAHRDFPTLLAEALDVVAECGDELTLAANRLGVSTSQLVSLFRKHPPALLVVNDRRKQIGLAPLK